MLPDPRRFQARSGRGAAFASLYDLVEQSLGAETAQVATSLDERLDVALADLVAAGDGPTLGALIDDAPSLPVQRTLWRMLATRLARDDAKEGGGGVGLTPFFIPVVIVAASSGGGVTLPGVIDDPGALVRLLVAHDALRGCRTLSLSPSLVAAAALALERLPAWVAAATRPAGHPLDLAPAPLTVERQQGAHLRFLAGIAVASPPMVDGDPAFRSWAAPLARELGAQLAHAGVTLLALPRPPAALLQALMRGRAAHREVAAQLFASESLRELRASVGEPVAILSAHLCAEVPGGGELRLSLSSPFSPRDAYGFRCPLQPGEGVSDAAAMLMDLLRDCRVVDVRTLAGVHPDKDAVTGGALFFKPGSMPPGAESPVH